MPFYISPKLLKYFKGFCSSPEIIMLFVYMKCRFSLSYRDLEEMAIIRGDKIDYATLQRWVIKFVKLIDMRVRKGKKSVGNIVKPIELGDTNFVSYLRKQVSRFPPTRE